MLETGSPTWLLLAFGVVTIPMGLYVWHKMGSLGELLKQPQLVSQRFAYSVSLAAAVVIALELLLSSRI